jgi:molecular chaperone DnaK
MVQRFVEGSLGKKVEGGVDPMECVSMGAAIQAGVLKGEIKDVLLLDVTPLSLGIETLGGVFTKLIERNTTVPTRKSQVFSTAQDNQSAVTIRVLQGERQMSADNTELGRFDLIGIPPAPRSIPQIEVTFDIDANGIVHVSAKDLGTGKEQSIKITAPDKLSEGEINRMVKEAEQFAEADKKRKEVVEARNQADQLIYATEKSMKDLGEKLGSSERQAIEQKIKALRETLKSEDPQIIRKDTEELMRSSHKIAEEVYKQTQAAGSQAGSAAGAGQQQEEPAQKSAGGDDRVVDAEFKVQDDKK